MQFYNIVCIWTLLLFLLLCWCDLETLLAKLVIEFFSSDESRSDGDMSNR